jgi:sec-independent protein translocase protein TatA
MFGLKMGELLIIFLVILVLFGGTKLPQLGSSLGQAIRNFKKGFGGDAAADAQGDAQRDALSTGGPDANKTSPRSPASASKDA